MTIFVEVSKPFQWRAGFFKSRLMYRVWWLWFAVGVLRVPFDEFCMQSSWVDTKPATMMIRECKAKT